MEGSPPFEALCAELETVTSMSRLEARGTLRLVLREAGLEPHTASTKPLLIVVERLLPALLRKRGVPDVPAVVMRLQARLHVSESMRPPKYDAPEDILDRFGRGK